MIMTLPWKPYRAEQQRLILPLDLEIISIKRAKELAEILGDPGCMAYLAVICAFDESSFFDSLESEFETQFEYAEDIRDSALCKTIEKLHRDNYTWAYLSAFFETHQELYHPLHLDIGLYDTVDLERVWKNRIMLNLIR